MISVVIPAFNEGEGIEACLKSVCDQTLPRDQYEVIVVDGNSKDNTREIAAKYYPTQLYLCPIYNYPPP